MSLCGTLFTRLVCEQSKQQSLKEREREFTLTKVAPGCFPTLAVMEVKGTLIRWKS